MTHESPPPPPPPPHGVCIQVAIKRVQDTAVDATSLRRLMRELALLRRSRGHSNVMEIRDLIVMTRTVNQVQLET